MRTKTAGQCFTALAAVVVLVANIPTAWAQADRCNLKQLCKDREDYPFSPERYSGRIVKGRKINSGNPNGIALADACQNQAKCAHSDPRRIKDLFADAKTRTAQSLLKGRAESSLSEIEKSLLLSLRSSKLAEPAIRGPCQSYCAVGGVARMLPNREVCLCNILESYSDENIMYILGHELAHAMDLCRSPLGQKSYSPDQHPFSDKQPRSLIQCLHSNGIRHASDVDPVGSAKRQRHLIESNFSGHVAQILNAPVINWFTKGLAKAELKSQDFDSDHEHCQGPLGHSQMVEAVADQVGFEVQASFLKDYPPTAKEKNSMGPRLFGMLLRDACGPELPQDQFAVHPPARTRIERIALMQPEIRAALGCAGHIKGLQCEYQPPTSPAQPPAQKLQGRD